MKTKVNKKTKTKNVIVDKIVYKEAKENILDAISTLSTATEDLTSIIDELDKSVRGDKLRKCSEKEIQDIGQSLWEFGGMANDISEEIYKWKYSIGRLI